MKITDIALTREEIRQIKAERQGRRTTEDRMFHAADAATTKAIYGVIDWLRSPDCPYVAPDIAYELEQRARLAVIYRPEAAAALDTGEETKKQ